MEITLSYMHPDTLEAMERDLDDGLFFEIDRWPKRAHMNVRRPNAIRRRLVLVRAELSRRRKGKHAATKRKL